MSGWWNGFLVVFLSCFLAVNTKLELTSTLRLAHCRVSCLFKIQMYNMTDSTCSATLSCKQCWDTCNFLLKDKTNLHYCKKPSCGIGCQEACRYHQMSPKMIRAPVLLTHHEESLTTTSAELRWPGTTSAVYIVLSQGEPLQQTLDSRVSLPPGPLEEVRVLKVDWRGQTTVLGPRLESSLARLRTVLRSLGLPQPPSTTLSKSPNLPLDWRLQEGSMISRDGVVVAKISWDSNQVIQPADTTSQLTYLVTWDVEGGVVRGNLLTNSTTATLSLKPDTVYTIQVSVVKDEGGVQSEPLVLDTHNAHKTTITPESSSSSPEISSHTSSQPTLHSSSEPSTPLMTHILHPPQTSSVDSVALVVASVTTLVMLMVLISSWRCRHRLSLPHSQLIVEDEQSPSLYRVFSPAVRLIGERKDISPHLYTSTDNLLQQ